MDNVLLLCLSKFVHKIKRYLYLNEIRRRGIAFFGDLNVLQDQVLLATLTKHLFLVVDQVRNVEKEFGSFVRRVAEEAMKIRDEGCPDFYLRTDL